MRMSFLAATLAALSGCAAGDRLADNAPPDAAVANAARLDAVEVAIESLPDERECTRRAPTGSRIVVERCVERTADREAMQASIQSQSQSELDEMRRRQMYQEQARQHAVREAMMRSRGRP